MTTDNPTNSPATTTVEGPRILATFQPQAWVNDDAVDSAAAITFDVTAQIIALTDEHGPQWVLDNVKDNRDISDDLWLDNPASADHPHTGPFIVTVENAILDYFDWRTANPTAAGRYENAVTEAAQETAAAADQSSDTDEDDEDADDAFDADGQYLGDHDFRNGQDCQDAGVHLTNVDENGFCNYCGHDTPHLPQYEVTFTFGAHNDEQATTMIQALRYAIETNDALPDYDIADFTNPRPRKTWPDNDTERSAFADWQYLAANGDTIASFRDWYATRND